MTAVTGHSAGAVDTAPRKRSGSVFRCAYVCELILAIIILSLAIACLVKYKNANGLSVIMGIAMASFTILYAFCFLSSCCTTETWNATFIVIIDIASTALWIMAAVLLLLDGLLDWDSKARNAPLIDGPLIQARALIAPRGVIEPRRRGGGGSGRGSSITFNPKHAMVAAGVMSCFQVILFLLSICVHRYEFGPGKEVQPEEGISDAPPYKPTAPTAATTTANNNSNYYYGNNSNNNTPFVQQHASTYTPTTTDRYGACCVNSSTNALFKQSTPNSNPQAFIVPMGNSPNGPVPPGNTQGPAYYLVLPLRQGGAPPPSAGR